MIYGVKSYHYKSQLFGWLFYFSVITNNSLPHREGGGGSVGLLGGSLLHLLPITQIACIAKAWHDILMLVHAGVDGGSP